MRIFQNKQYMHDYIFTQIQWVRMDEEFQWIMFERFFDKIFAAMATAREQMRRKNTIIFVFSDYFLFK